MKIIVFLFIIQSVHLLLRPPPKKNYRTHHGFLRRDEDTIFGFIGMDAEFYFAMRCMLVYSTRTFNFP